MFNTLLSYLPIIAGPLLAAGLVAVLRHWVKPAAAARLSAPGAESTPATDASPDESTWSDAATQTNPLVAYVLPIFTSVAVVLLALWPFTYLGWGLSRLAPDPGWYAQVPPWFGNPGYFLGFGIVGLAFSIMGVLLVAGTGVGLHMLGKCILSPALCAGLDATSDESDAEGEDEDDDDEPDDDA